MMFRFAHATHHRWAEALELVLTQLEGQFQLEQFAPDPTRPLKIGLMYVTEPFAAELSNILVVLKRRTLVKQWVGGVTPGVVGTGVEYNREPAIAVMILELNADSARVFSGKQPIPRFDALNVSGRPLVKTALVHIDAKAESIEDLIEDLCMKVPGQQIVGGLMSATEPYTHLAIEPLQGGVSGLVFAENAMLETRITQGVSPVGSNHTVTGIRGSFITSLDDLPALEVLLTEVGFELPMMLDDDFQKASDVLAKRFGRGLFVGLQNQDTRHVALQKSLLGGRPERHEWRVRPVVGIDVSMRGLAIAEDIEVGDVLRFCTRDEQAARTDLTRMCAELREDLGATAPKINELQAAGFAGMRAAKVPRGALYIACNGRGAAMFGHSGVELQIIREQLGDIPLVGFMANGEVFQGALYGYSGVLTLFF